MASGVYENPVTDLTVQQVFIGMNVADITARHRAEVALMYMNDGDKAQQARKFASDLYLSQRRNPATLCAIYNATGSNLTFVRSQNWYGQVWGSHYPQTIRNGQWGAFLHARESSTRNYSKGAVVYRGANLAGSSREWVLAWSMDGDETLHCVYTEVRENSNTIDWSAVDRLMRSNPLNRVVSNQLGCFSSVAMGGAYTGPNFTAILALSGVNTRDATALANDPEHTDDDHVVDEPAAAAE